MVFKIVAAGLRRAPDAHLEFDLMISPSGAHAIVKLTDRVPCRIGHERRGVAVSKGGLTFRAGLDLDQFLAALHGLWRRKPAGRQFADIDQPFYQRQQPADGPPMQHQTARHQ